MHIFNKILEVSFLASEITPGRDWGFVLMKCNEELGEMGDAAFFVQEEKLEGEVADFIISMVDLFFLTVNSNGSKEEIIDSLSLTLSKNVYYEAPEGSDPISSVIDLCRFNKMCSDTFPHITSSYGKMSRALNQPERSEKEHSEYLCLAINNAINLLCSFYEGQHPVVTYRMLDRQVDLKLAKWKLKAGL